MFSEILEKPIFDISFGLIEQKLFCEKQSGFKTKGLLHVSVYFHNA